MPYVKNWLHCVWGTKNKVGYLTSNIKVEVIRHILLNAREKSIYIDIINGYTQHIHCLLSLNHDMSLSKTMQLIKGESSHWINKNSLTTHKFEWADEYYGVSISESHLNRVRAYIRNQEIHHKVKTWDEEADDFIRKYGFNRFPG